ncbi:unnamed protein product [Cladocopium goreaui]|uniref:Uncharacterized protein n=1 Tax=Cladocopium goreaui TaxID=2562237 RepID=A0A9P1CKN0_9DINO|nr:unnamed protein product [Cladocopium goreaui]
MQEPLGETAGSQLAAEGQQALQDLLQSIKAQSAAIHSDVAAVRRHYTAASQAVSKVRFEALCTPKSRENSKSLAGRTVGDS